MSVKHCPKCGKQGSCYDSRHNTKNGSVRRRYRCTKRGCKERWTTAEFLVARGSKRIAGKVDAFVRKVEARGAKLAKARLLAFAESLA